jgi:hypothetical protein
VRLGQGGRARDDGHGVAHAAEAVAVRAGFDAAAVHGRDLREVPEPSTANSFSVATAVSNSLFFVPQFISVRNIHFSVVDHKGRFQIRICLDVFPSVFALDMRQYFPVFPYFNCRSTTSRHGQIVEMFAVSEPDRVYRVIPVNKVCPLKCLIRMTNPMRHFDLGGLAKPVFNVRWTRA